MAYCVELFPKHPKSVVTAKSAKQKYCYVKSLTGVHELPQAGFWFDQQCRGKGHVSEVIMAWVLMYRYPDGHPSLLRMEKWALWTKTKRGDVRTRKVMKKFRFVYVGRREVG